MLPEVAISLAMSALCLKIQLHQFYMFLWFGNYMHCPWFSSKEMTFLKRSKPETLSKLYRTCMGQRLDKLRQRKPEVVPKNEKSFGVYSREILYFVKEVHESYGLFIEIPIEQFSAVSYGDVPFGQQLGIYLHRTVESASQTYCIESTIQCPYFGPFAPYK
ncbi:hypothetical protein AMTRI_Chr02g224490 [Amborella trichopoda]